MPETSEPTTGSLHAGRDSFEDFLLLRDDGTSRSPDGTGSCHLVSMSDRADAEVTVKYMVMTYGGPSDWEALAGTGPNAMSPAEIAAHFEAMQALHEELAATGELVTAFGLSEPASAQTVDIHGGTPVVSDGPYAETKEFLAGFGIIDVATHERAIELAARFAGVVSTRVELRPVYG
ncbi:YciI family protein [Micromonospora globbae]|uniref:YciI family protein n=1 Tax=Micromonospora globbae TaxID=1894969 RepID=A0ABZ1SFS0_9ACTN|nr:YciI family protein [Micromonospora globbae]WTF88697.1 YciI family protein [Micromonospora globbae]